MTAKDWLFVALVAMLVLYLTVFVSGILGASRKRAVSRGVDPDGAVAPSLLMLVVGFVTNFFDTLGIGSFATTTAAFKLNRLVPVRLIPGTLNVGHTIPTIAQAFIYTKIVPVDSFTLISMSVASAIGSWLGARRPCYCLAGRLAGSDFFSLRSENVRSSKLVTASAFVHRPIPPASGKVSSSTSRSFLPSR